MTSTDNRSYSKRFRDIAALFDLADGESEVTATTSFHNRTTNAPFGVGSNSNGNSYSFWDKLQQQFGADHQQHQQRQQLDVYQEEEPAPRPTLSKSSRELASFFEKKQEGPHRSIRAVDTNAALDGDDHDNDEYQHELDDEDLDYESQIIERDHDLSCSFDYQYGFHSGEEDEASLPFSSAELSTEAETGRHWGRTTSGSNSLYHSRRNRARGLLFRQQLHEERGRLGKLRETTTTTSVLEQKLRMHQPKELVLNTTDSTDSCTLSRTTGGSQSQRTGTGTPQRANSTSCSTSSSNSTSNSTSNSNSHHGEADRELADRNLSYELPSPIHSCSTQSTPQNHHRPHYYENDDDTDMNIDVDMPDDELRDELLSRSSSFSSALPPPPENDSDEQETEGVPSWKLRQREKMQERMEELEFLASPSLEASRGVCSEGQPPSSPVAPEDASDVPVPATPPRFGRQSFDGSGSDRDEEEASSDRDEGSWRARQFRRTFRHRAGMRRRNWANPNATADTSSSGAEEDASDGESQGTEPEPDVGPTEPETPSRPEEEEEDLAVAESPRRRQPDCIDTGSPSSVQLLRSRFESPLRRGTGAMETSLVDCMSPSSSTTSSAATPVTKAKVVMDASKLHERRQNHRVVAYPCLKKTGSSDHNHNRSMESDRGEANEEDTDAKPPQTAETEPSPPAEWWTEMEERVERYQRSVLARHERRNTGESKGEDQDAVLLRQSFEEFASGQNQLGRSMAVALFRGIQIASDLGRGPEESTRTEAHARELQALKEAHAKELRELKEQLDSANTISTASASNNSSNNNSANTASRNEAFRQRWKNRMNNNNNNNTIQNNAHTPTVAFSGDTNHETNDDYRATEVASTVVSTMSCRELSVARYRARLLEQMNRGRGTLVATGAGATRREDSGVDGTNGGSAESRDGNDAEEIQRLLDELQQAERRQKLLEKQLQQAGVVLAEDIPYQLAKDKVASISKRMNEIGSSGVVHSDPLVQKQLREEYFRLEKDMQKYISALMLTDEYAEERRSEEEAWEARNKVANQKALETIRRSMPVDVRRLTPSQLEDDYGLPGDLVKRFRRINVLQLLRVDPAIVAKWHPSSVEALRVTGLTITERRALHCYLSPVVCKWNGSETPVVAAGNTGTDAMTQRKLAWFGALRTNFKEALGEYERHLSQRPGPGSCASKTCGLMGNRCPVRANAAVKYPDLGHPSHGAYEAPFDLVAGGGDQKSPAEVIAESRRSGPTVVEGAPKARTLVPAPSRKASAPKRDEPPRRPVVPKAAFAPSGLLAAIAARRID